MAQEIEILLYRDGLSTPFLDWLASLRDARAVGIVRARLNRIRLGNFGDCKSVGRGVEELRIVVVLLCGGDKRTQTRDIRIAQKYWEEYLNAKTDP
ncbi:MAG: type II toxin-antitoxin system RelE/ParE family toxin [Bryobacteraceae bacterium]